MTDFNLMVANVSAGSAIIASIISSLTYYKIEKMRSENEKRKLLLQRQEQACSQLTGLKFVTIQLYLRLNDTFSTFEWIKARERLQLPNRSDLGKIGEERRKYDEFGL